jgi:predicted naringenin-chalcone synthase
MRTELIGLGTALPAGSLTQAGAAAAAHRLRSSENDPNSERKGQLLAALYRRSGVKTRHSVLLRSGNEEAYDRQTFYGQAADETDLGPTTEERMKRFEQAAPELAAAACEEALNTAGLTGVDVRHLVTVSCSGFAAPGYDLSLYQALDLAPNVSRTNVGFMGCHGALNGLRVARALSIAHPDEPVLVCATELCTLHHQYTDDPQQIVANSLFSDGAAAVVLRSTAASQQPVTISSGSGKQWRLLHQSSCVLSDSAEMMTWRVGNNGFQMTLSAQVPEVIRQQLKPWLSAWLATQGKNLEDISTWAVHPGGPRILTATSEALELAENQLEVSLGVLAECGNMSSPTILFILKRLLEQSSSGPCVALAFGPGLVVEAALLEC